jgi:cytochrome c peroxidase
MRCHRLLAALGLAATASAQLPPPWSPPQNPQTPAKIVLGKILFWDEQLSSDDSVACGTCHRPEFGGSDGRLLEGWHAGPDGLIGTPDDIRASAGVVRQDASGDFTPSSTFGLAVQKTGRMSPTMAGAAYHAELFWDGRASGEFYDPETGLLLIPFGGALESQAVGPILNAVEMAQEGRTWNDVRSKLAAATPLRLASNLPADVQAALQQQPTYPLLFTAAFGDPAINGARIGMALASYQRTLVPDDTPWDRHMAGQAGALTPAENFGLQVFQNQGQCVACHWEPLFSDDLYHSLGLRPKAEDLGRYVVSQQGTDQAAFKTPTLRLAGLRPRLFHNGQSPALGDATQWTDPASTLNVYWLGHGAVTTNLSPFLSPLQQFGVPQSDVHAALEFVRTALTDARAQNRLPPFDHPDLRSAVVPAPRVFGSGLAGASVPFLIDAVPPYPGNADYKLGLAGGDGTTFSFLTYGFWSIEPQATVLGVPLHLQIAGWQPFTLSGPAGAPGHTTWRLPLPNDPSLNNAPFYFELFALDPLAPAGVAASAGTEFFIR